MKLLCITDLHNSGTRMYQFTEEELAELLRAGYADLGSVKPHVVLAHPPPQNDHLDRTSRRQHVGSTALRAFIDRHQPALVFCGHVHEGRGMDTFGSTTVVNCGLAAVGYYAIAEVGDEVSVELRQA